MSDDKPKLTSIEGGRKDPPGPRPKQEPPDYEAGNFVYHFSEMIVEVLRALARGDDRRARITTHFVAAVESAGKMKAPLPATVDRIVSDLYEQFEKQHDYGTLIDFRHIVLASLQVAAEGYASDNAARGRASKRRETLRHAVDAYVEGWNRPPRR